MCFLSSGKNCTFSGKSLDSVKISSIYENDAVTIHSLDLDSRLSLINFFIQNFNAPAPEQAGLCLTWLETLRQVIFQRRSNDYLLKL